MTQQDALRIAVEALKLSESLLYETKHGDESISDAIKICQSALQDDGEPVVFLACKNTELQKRVSVLEDLLSSAYNIANRNGENTHWLRFSAQLHINGITPVTAKTFKILPSDMPEKAEKDDEAVAWMFVCNLAGTDLLSFDKPTELNSIKGSEVPLFTRAAPKQYTAAAKGSNPPYSNCSFKICDLPGVCTGHGKCHHPATQKQYLESDIEEAIGAVDWADLGEFATADAVKQIVMRFVGSKVTMEVGSD